jgi:hypothetical protein
VRPAEFDYVRRQACFFRVSLNSGDEVAIVVVTASVGTNLASEASPDRADRVPGIDAVDGTFVVLKPDIRSKSVFQFQPINVQGERGAGGNGCYHENEGGQPY